jgi:hypothetical protein
MEPVVRLLETDGHGRIAQNPQNLPVVGRVPKPTPRPEF